jgi:hypothetical protein
LLHILIWYICLWKWNGCRHQRSFRAGVCTVNNLYKLVTNFLNWRGPWPPLTPLLVVGMRQLICFAVEGTICIAIVHLYLSNQGIEEAIGVVCLCNCASNNEKSVMFLTVQVTICLALMYCSHAASSWANPASSKQAMNN